MSKVVRQLLPFATLAILVAALSALEPDTFLTTENFLNVLSRSSVNGIIAMGMTAVIISGGIDLSVGSMLALAGMVGAGVMLKVGGPTAGAGACFLGTVVGIGAGLLCGLLNGTLITKLKLPPFIVTLGTMSAFRGASYIINNSKMFDVPMYTFLGQSTLLGVPVSVVILAVVVLLGFFVLRYTPLGRYTYAIGSNRQAAFHAGVNVDRNLIAIYSMMGAFVGLAAMIQTSRTISAQPTAGISLELDIIAAVVIGGASLAGGRGTIVGTIVGTLLISFLRNGCTLLGISTNIQLVVIGAIIIGAVALDQVARSRADTP